MTVTIACVWTGAKYGPEYVARLQAMVARHLTVPHVFLCLTDRLDARALLPVDVRVIDVTSLELLGWWNKMALFDPAIRGLDRCIYFDLDTVIVGDLDPLLEWHGKFGICENFAQLAGVPGWPCAFGSCVMSFAAGWDSSAIWQGFLSDHTQIMKECGRGDQQAIERLIPDAWMLQHYLPEDFFINYRDLPKHPAAPPAGAAVVVFGGRNTPANCQVSWVRQAWLAPKEEGKKMKPTSAEVAAAPSFLKYRQVAPYLAGIREDHTARYRYAAAEASKRNMTTAYDIGCGSGYGSFILAAEGGLIVSGNDRVQDCIDYGNEHYKHPNIDRICGDLSDMFPEGGDWRDHDDAMNTMIAAFEIVEHSNLAPAFLKRAAEHAFLLVGSVPNQDVVPYDPAKFNPEHYRHYTHQEITDELKAADWRVMRLGSQTGKKGPGAKVRNGVFTGRTLVFVAKSLKFRQPGEKVSAGRKT